MSVQSLYTAATGMESLQTKLNVIANNLVGVELSSPRRGEADYSVDGEVPTVSSRRFHGLFLSLRKRSGDALACRCGCGRA
jgi:hypothetical protein